uniref:CDK5RAP1-like protein n=1 Tax=Lygus hesperus TaxID=30085 RepID=A0A146KQN1_LYGHE
MLSRPPNHLIQLLNRNFSRRLFGSNRSKCNCEHYRTLSTSLMNFGPLKPGPSLKDFLSSQKPQEAFDVDPTVPPYIHLNEIHGQSRYVFFEVYGCQMNVNDTEIVWSILKTSGYLKTDNIRQADVVLLMTCSIRDNAEKKIWHRLNELKALRRSSKAHFKVGILGCMAERLKQKLIEEEKLIDVVAGPDSYKDLPRLLSVSSSNQAAINVMLSLDETYADITPVRLNENAVSAFVSIMRGCNNMCTYCIVPFTRGRERSRPADSILREIEVLSKNGVKEVTLLGQNVNSYRDTSDEGKPSDSPSLAKGFKTVYKLPKGGMRFAELLDKVASVDPEMRIRYTSPHPKDFPDEVLQVIADRKNVCASMHLPAQSGNSQVLERMRRGYTREAYLELAHHIKDILPGVALSSDFICGFCGETDLEFSDTLTLFDEVGYNVAYLFAYSMREKTTAHRRYVDDVPEEVKKERLIEMSKTFRRTAHKLNQSFVGKDEIILVEGTSKRSKEFLAGRNDGNIKVIIPSIGVPVHDHSDSIRPIQVGDYVKVRITEANSQVLKGNPIYHCKLSS